MSPSTRIHHIYNTKGGEPYSSEPFGYQAKFPTPHYSDVGEIFLDARKIYPNRVCPSKSYTQVGYNQHCADICGMCLNRPVLTTKYAKDQSKAQQCNH